MTNNEANGNKQGSWARSVRIAAYAVILLTIFLWMRHEKSEREAARAATNETEAKRQRENVAESHRVEAAFALVKNAESVEAPMEKIRIYDEIIDTYQGEKTIPMQRCVSWALYKKALIVPDASEKSRFYGEVVDKYCDVPDKTVSRYVMAALNEMIQLADSGAEKIALCDRILERKGNHLSDALTARLMSKKAESIRDREELIALYDVMLSRFLSSSDDSAFDLAVIAALDKLKLVTDEGERLRLCDIAIDAFLKTPQRTRYYLFEQAIDQKAKIVGDPSFPLKIWNQVIANNVTEESVMQARSLRMPLLKNDDERLAACNETIAIHQNSESDFVQLMVVRAMMQKARLLSDPEEKAALLRSVVEKSRTVEDSRARGEADHAVAMLATLSGDTASAILHYDEEAAKTKNRVDAIRSLKSKIRLIENRAEKIRLLDEIIAMIGASNETLESREAISAIFQKVRLTDNKEGKIGLYDDIIARGGKSGDRRQRADAAEAMLAKANLLDDPEEKIRLYDEIISRGMDGGEKEWLDSAAQAMLAKAKLIYDGEERIRLYDTVLFDMGQVNGSYFLSDAFRDRIKLAAGVDEKLQLYDRFIATEAGTNPNTRISLLLDKANLMNNPGDISRLYDEIIEYCGRYLGAGGNDGVPPSFKIYERNSITDKLGQAILGKADMLNNSKEKLQLYDKYLAIPQSADPYSPNEYLKKILARKAELSGVSSVEREYYDEKIRTAATDHERIGWYRCKAWIGEIPERAAVMEEIITKFSDSVDIDIEKTVATTFLDKIRLTLDVGERNALCDRVIARYRDSDNNRIRHAVVQAFALKAETTKDNDAKNGIYNEAIERYKNVDDFLVKEAVKSIIAAKSRLEEEIKE